MHVCLQTACLRGHQGDNCVLTLAALFLRLQGCCAITKTALSITLTDRLKRGFNSYSSPRALHHRGHHPSTPRLPPSLAFYRRLLSITPGSRAKMAPDAPEDTPTSPLTHPRYPPSASSERSSSGGRMSLVLTEKRRLNIDSRMCEWSLYEEVVSPRSCPYQSRRCRYPCTGGRVSPSYKLQFAWLTQSCPSTFRPSFSAWELASPCGTGGGSALTSPLTEFLPRLYSAPLKVHSLARRHREENQKAL